MSRSLTISHVLKDENRHSLRGAFGICSEWYVEAGYDTPGWRTMRGPKLRDKWESRCKSDRKCYLASCLCLLWESKNIMLITVSPYRKTHLIKRTRDAKCFQGLFSAQIKSRITRSLRAYLVIIFSPQFWKNNIRSKFPKSSHNNLSLIYIYVCIY